MRYELRALATAFCSYKLNLEVDLATLIPYVQRGIVTSCIAVVAAS